MLTLTPYGSPELQLPPIPIPPQLQEYIVNAQQPLSASELRHLCKGSYSSTATRTFNRLCLQQEAAEQSHTKKEVDDELIFRELQNNRI
ncbi:hypothetical protein BS17DRAFT_823116 [Gyrodon lividus]|nr:hypothetical protein BS17DRAFT_823116 [Gyrodon lividus]